ncbi:hypothetical protein KCU61_g2094, partial [Aureobasidium melanogenum]
MVQRSRPLIHVSMCQSVRCSHIPHASSFAATSKSGSSNSTLTLAHGRTVSPARPLSVSTPQDTHAA